MLTAPSETFADAERHIRMGKEGAQLETAATDRSTKRATEKVSGGRSRANYREVVTIVAPEEVRLESNPLDNPRHPVEVNHTAYGSQGEDTSFKAPDGSIVRGLQGDDRILAPTRV